MRALWAAPLGASPRPMGLGRCGYLDGEVGGVGGMALGEGGVAHGGAPDAPPTVARRMKAACTCA